MRRTTRKLSLLALVLLAPGLIAGCGNSNEEDELHAVEGEPLELGSLLYNVQITRFLNPSDVEDSGYLEGLPDPDAGQDYLAVFMRIQNEGEEAQAIASSFTITTSRRETFEPLEIENPFALPLGAEIPAGGQLPAIDSAPASGPIKGSMVLYLIDTAATDNRPLELEIPGPDGENGTIELDI
ncbi:MAG: hypothetical protein E4H22_04395 [Solirubrobacterales bacterium]|nr:MAG: hypothetical protein E4H22_04395 [Solirubrobacterales bacterium]